MHYNGFEGTLHELRHQLRLFFFTSSSIEVVLPYAILACAKKFTYCTGYKALGALNIDPIT